MADTKDVLDKAEQSAVAPASQAGALSTIGAGHPATPQYLPGNIAGNRSAPTTASVSGQTPITNR